jgi:hypothetical protein
MRGETWSRGGRRSEEPFASFQAWQWDFAVMMVLWLEISALSTDLGSMLECIASAFWIVWDILGCIPTDCIRWSRASRSWWIYRELSFLSPAQR